MLFSRLLPALTLREAGTLGIARVLLTCDKDNVASAKVIVDNGGELDSEYEHSVGRIKQRYWIGLYS